MELPDLLLSPLLCRPFLRELQQRRDLTYIFISHDLSVVKFMADTMAVMQAGKIVEQRATVLSRQMKGM